jgi:hypothetical protein
MPTPEQGKRAEEVGLSAQVQFWRSLCDDLTAKLAQALVDKTMPAAPNPVVETDALLDHITYLESELEHVKAVSERYVEHIVEHKASRDRLLKRLLEVVAERDELRRMK